MFSTAIIESGLITLSSNAGKGEALAGITMMTMLGTEIWIGGLLITGITSAILWVW